MSPARQRPATRRSTARAQARPGKAPTQAVLRAYNVGFGDCLLLTFVYPQAERHVLIDFGSTRVPRGDTQRLQSVAADIAQRCGGKLHVVVATHRHKDHVSGFATATNGRGPGDVIRALDPDVVIQPWTEHPDAQPDASAPPRGPRTGHAARAFTAELAGMQACAAGTLAESSRLRTLAGALGARVAHEQLAFLGDDNIANRSAVENLMSMGRRRLYVAHGDDLRLGALLPGVRVHVLGPPTLEQSDAIRKQRKRDPVEFWQMQAHAARPAAGTDALFPRARTVARLPPEARWFARRLVEARGSSLLELVRMLDEQMNNTSVILLFEAGGKRLLFPGDAQWENWSYALSQKDNVALLRATDLYKVGHHGSLNATPRASLWAKFAKRSATPGRRLKSVVSTLGGVHGSNSAHTEVPRSTLLEALGTESDLLDTRDARTNAKPYVEVTLDL